MATIIFVIHLINEILFELSEYFFSIDTHNLFQAQLYVVGKLKKKQFKLGFKGTKNNTDFSEIIGY